MDKTARIGRYIKSPVVPGEPYKSYIPADLPFMPAIDMTDISLVLSIANNALDRLDGMSMVLPDPSLLIIV